jgi:hypothetical protein
MLVEVPGSFSGEDKCLESLQLWWMRFARFETVLNYSVIGALQAWKYVRAFTHGALGM